MNIMSYISILSNIFLFAFASHKIVEVFPWLFNLNSDPTILLYTGVQPDQGKGRYLIAIVFIIENIMFLIVYFIRTYIKNSHTYDWVDTYHKRK